MNIAALGLAGVAALIGTSAFAADMAVKAPPLASPVTALSWTGYYIGLNGGYGWRDSSQINFAANDPLSALILGGLGIGGGPVVPPANQLRGGFGGFQIGYNWQFNPKWLVGIETDFQGSSIDGTGTTASLVSAPTLTASVAADQHVRWFGTIRPRLGFLPSDNLLIYGTGGLAYGRIDENINIGFAGTSGSLIVVGIGAFNAPCVGGGLNCFIGASSRTAIGWTAGAGGEYAVSRNVTVKAEFLYVDLGGDSFNVVAQNPAPSTFRAGWGATVFQTIRAGLNYKF
jgi:outer membrane immunogenic protein